MKPYFQEDGITIYHGDCREVLPFLDPIDVVITDPPYGDTSLDWDKPVPLWPQQIYPMARDSASLWCFGSFRMFYESDGFVPWKLAQDIVWEKHNGSSFHADRFKRVHEHAVHFYKGKWESLYKNPIYTADATARTVRRKQRPPHIGHIEAGSYTSEDGGPRLMRSVIYARSCHGEAVHPTQKPISIIAPLVEYSCKPISIVLDPFCGSGSTLIACKLAGVNSIGIEINERYCELAAKRLAQSVLDLREPSPTP
jgi:site-specific DNA-methyltransferase (adenine-specific)